MRSQKNKLKFLLFVFISITVSIKCDKFMEEQGVKLRLERVKCKCEPTVCLMVCNVKFISRDIANLNTLVKVLKPLNYIGYRLKTYYKHSNNEYRPMIMDVRDEFCESYVKHSKILDLLLAQLGTHINFNKPCPWLPGDYYVKDFNFSIKHVPSLIPEGRYIMNITMYGPKKEFYVYWEVYFEVKNHGILDLRFG